MGWTFAFQISALHKALFVSCYFKTDTVKINLFKKDKIEMIKPTTKVYRKQIIEGYSIPAFIKNGSYFFVDLDVYENGRVHCWNFEEFEYFKKDVEKNWVSLSIPDNNEISIHGLGNWTINEGNWEFNKKTFVDYIQRLIKELNPNLENIYKYSEKKVNGISIGENGGGTVYKEIKKYPNDIFPEKINGQSVDLFYKDLENYYLIKVNVFSDNTIQLSRLENTTDLTLEEFEKLIQEGKVLTEIPLNSTVSIYGLGNFKITKVQYVTSIQEKLIEIKDILKDLNGEPSSIEICREALQNYNSNPTVENRNKLKISYENVPDHQKMYVGDMDTKDIEVRMIIYGENEIENWSHYQVAKSLGQTLPTIKITKPNDEKNNS